MDHGLVSDASEHSVGNRCANAWPDAWAQQQKFVTAKAPQQIICAQRLANAFDDHFKHFVARQMTAFGVHDTEVVDVKHHQRNGLRSAARCTLGGRFKGRAIEYTRQRITRPLTRNALRFCLRFNQAQREFIHRRRFTATARLRTLYVFNKLRGDTLAFNLDFFSICARHQIFVQRT